ncbi:hypothetical protein QJS66_20135 [Kocuria rhizophila]|nr:hypothetical protein QJS66_20135 [Kocuria rhizophila]
MAHVHSAGSSSSNAPAPARPYVRVAAAAAAAAGLYAGAPGEPSWWSPRWPGPVRVHPQLERVLYADALTGTASAQPLSLDEQVDHRRSIGSPDSPVNVQPPTADHACDVRGSPHWNGAARAVFGTRRRTRHGGGMTVYGAGRALPLRTTIDRLHRDLLGEPGRC